MKGKEKRKVTGIGKGLDGSVAEVFSAGAKLKSMSANGLRVEGWEEDRDDSAVSEKSRIPTESV